MLGTNDRYWPLDAANLYWDGLQGQKHILYVPNKGHDLADLERVIGGLTALHRMNAGGPPLPKLDWKLTPNGHSLELDLAIDTPPTQVQVWTTSADTRDFREAKWTPREVPAQDGRFRYELAYPDRGFAAMFGEARFAGEGVPFYLSTNVRIVGPAKEAAGGGK
jgi:PhoPQ-activated pathogenicity-related protein